MKHIATALSVLFLGILLGFALVPPAPEPIDLTGCTYMRQEQSWHVWRCGENHWTENDVGPDSRPGLPASDSHAD